VQHLSKARGNRLPAHTLRQMLYRNLSLDINVFYTPMRQARRERACQRLESAGGPAGW